MMPPPGRCLFVVPMASIACVGAAARSRRPTRPFPPSFAASRRHCVATAPPDFARPCWRCRPKEAAVPLPFHRPPGLNPQRRRSGVVESTCAPAPAIVRRRAPPPCSHSPPHLCAGDFAQRKPPRRCSFMPPPPASIPGARPAAWSHRLARSSSLSVVRRLAPPLAAGVPAAPPNFASVCYVAVALRGDEMRECRRGCGSGDDSVMPESSVRLPSQPSSSPIRENSSSGDSRPSSWTSARTCRASPTLALG